MEGKSQWHTVLALVAPVLVRVVLAAAILAAVGAGILPEKALDACLGLVVLRPSGS